MTEQRDLMLRVRELYEAGQYYELSGHAAGMAQRLLEVDAWLEARAIEADESSQNRDFTLEGRAMLGAKASAFREVQQKLREGV